MVPRPGRGTRRLPAGTITGRQQHPTPQPPCQQATRGRSPKAVPAALPETSNTVELGDEVADEADAVHHLVLGDAADLVEAHEPVDTEVGVGLEFLPARFRAADD